MEKKYFLAKLIPPRPSFTADMNAEERQVMMDHGAYLRKYVEAGTVIVMGPVLDPAWPMGPCGFRGRFRRRGPDHHRPRSHRPLRARFPVGDLPDAAGGCPELVPGRPYPGPGTPGGILRRRNPSEKGQGGSGSTLRITPGLANGARITDFIRAVFLGIRK